MLFGSAGLGLAQSDGCACWCKTDDEGGGGTFGNGRYGLCRYQKFACVNAAYGNARGSGKREVCSAGVVYGECFIERLSGIKDAVVNLSAKENFPCLAEFDFRLGRGWWSFSSTDNSKGVRIFIGIIIWLLLF